MTNAAFLLVLVFQSYPDLAPGGATLTDDTRLFGSGHFAPETKHNGKYGIKKYSGF